MSSSNEDIIFNLLNKCLTKGKRLNNGEALFHDPFSNHHKPKLAVNLRTFAWHSWIDNSKKGNNLILLLKKINASSSCIEELKKILFKIKPDFKNISEKNYSKNLELPVEFKPLYIKQKCQEYKHALSYLKNRGINAFDIIKYNIGICLDGKLKNRIVVPSYDENGILNYYSARTFYESNLKYINAKYPKENIIGFENHISWNFPITLCEGVFDAIAIKRNAIPLFGKTISEKLLQKIYYEGVEYVNIVLDNDAIKSIIQISRKLISDGIKVNYVKLNKKDPSEIGYENITELINSYNEIDELDLVKLKL
jgi:hypothetical protein